MNSSQVETTRDRISVSCIVAMLAALTCALTVLNTAELQSAATIIVRAQSPEATDSPTFDLGFAFMVAATVAPFVVMGTALFKRWSLALYLAWIVATVMFVFVVSGAAAFAAYRYWREHQTVAALNTIVAQASAVPPPGAAAMHVETGEDSAPSVRTAEGVHTPRRASYRARSCVRRARAWTASE